ncbi:MarC family NAAT transporter [Methylopila sp. M107]|uniref:MarC family NAAT transporter n=1 Tax=Methylopila sp. M107 TaxID=1101190 RepID=UPI00036DA209|nr:MarC family NAAT transporter [Methylopila sp. M107]
MSITAWFLAASQAFLLAGSALFSIINPLSGALIFTQVTAERTHAERVVLARKIAVYAEAVMLVSLWLGSYVLAFFGVSLPALRIAGGLVVAINGWRLLMAPEHHEERKQTEADQAKDIPEDVAFFPLTMPLTTGPGTIAVAIALGAARPSEGAALSAFAVGVSLAAVANAVAIWLAYSWADWIANLLGPGGVRVIGRLAAFLLLCVGVQITLSGVLDALHAGGIGVPR